MTTVGVGDPWEVSEPGAAAPGGEAPDVDALRRALRAYPHDRRLDADVLRALGVFCAALRARGRAGQHVVLALHDVWASLPEARALGGAEAGTLRGRLVTAAIATFYAPAPPPD